MRKTNTLMLTIKSVKNVSTVQIEYGKHSVIENSSWSDGTKFPLKALLIGVYKIFRIQLKENCKQYKTNLITKFVEL